MLAAILMLSTVSIAFGARTAHAQIGCVLGAAAAGGAAGAAGAGATAAPTGLPVKDIANNALLAANLTANTVTAANSTEQSTVTCILNGLAWTVAKLTIQSITRSTVNWINSGFSGSPAFVSDLNDNLKYLGDSVADNFFNQLNQATVDATGFNLTSPFQDQISQQLRTEYYRTTSGLLGLNQYDLSGHSTDPKAFLNGDFSKGGFNAFFSANGNPANNPFGAYQLASNQLYASIDAASQQRKAELDWGKGFLPWRGNCSPTNEGKKDSGSTKDIDEKGSSASVSLSRSEGCTGSPVRTPGSVIESQLENSLGTGIRQLELADSINEIVGALMGQLVNQVLGSNGLSGVSQPSSGGGSSYIDQATQPSQYSGLTSSLSDGVLQNISNDQSSFQGVRDDWQKVLDASNTAQQKCGMQTEITSASTRATAGIAKANAALQSLATVKAEVQNAAVSGAVNKSVQITTAITDYQSFLAAPTTPSAADIGDAAAASADTGDSTTTPSIYSRMIALQKNCSA